MSMPRAIVIPFGVPDESRGLGVGLAALLHACVEVDGGRVAVAQLHPVKKEEGTEPVASAMPVETFLSPAAWKQLSQRSNSLAIETLVLTGAFEPPVDGHGTIRLLAFDANDGRERARVEAHLDDARAGAMLVGAFEQLGENLGGRIGGLGALRDLEWESLESVLHAERCALFDPVRGIPYDRMAAMAHLGRAIGDAGDTEYASERLASIASEAAMQSVLDPKLMEAASRALGRALEDVQGDEGSARVNLIEAMAAIELRQGRPRDAEKRLNAALVRAPTRPQLYALLAHALRVQGQTDAALGVAQAGLVESSGNTHLLAERGLLLASQGNMGGAATSWREALMREPAHPVAFSHLAQLALQTKDTATGEALVDMAFAVPRPHVQVHRRAIQLILAIEPEGIARAARVSELCARILQQIPTDAGAMLERANADVVLGNKSSARALYNAVVKLGPDSILAAEAMVLGFALDFPAAEQELRSLVRAATSVSIAHLPDILARAKRFGTLHGAWPAWLAAGIAERRRGNGASALEGLRMALEIAPGAASVNIEMAEVLLERGDRDKAAEYATKVIEVEALTSRATAVLARAKVRRTPSFYVRWYRTVASLLGTKK